MRDLLNSKRVRITVVGLVVWAAARFGLDLDAAAIDQVLDLAMVLVASYGATGWGKERVAEAAKTGGTITSLEVTTTTMPPPTAGEPPARPVRVSQDLTAAGRLREEALRARAPKPPKDEP